jgi:hypothetical protein
MKPASYKNPLMPSLARTCLLFVAPLLSLPPLQNPLPAAPEEISLAGTWRLQLNTDATLPPPPAYSDTITLPGTLDEAGKGHPATPNTIELNRRHTYDGPAWYQRTIDIPDAWRGKRIQLHLERTRFTQIYLDGRLVATNNSLSAPHTATRPAADARPGTHTLAIQVNNDRKNYPMFFSHVWSDRIQTNWNGILGEIKLTARDPVFIDDAQLHPDIPARKLHLRLALGNTTAATRDATLAIRINHLPPTTRALRIAPGETTQQLTIPLPENLAPWDEFTPALHTLDLTLTTQLTTTPTTLITQPTPTPTTDTTTALTLTTQLTAPAPAPATPTQTAPATPTATDTRRLTFGLREFSQHNKKFTINHRPTLLRGRIDAGVFPLTGYAPMDEAAWTRHLRTAQQYGLNYIRFHSWCPPDAAFRAADKLGLYLQPELPAWAAYDTPGLPAYLHAEADRILRAYGNHPSFVMLTLGNELRGDAPGRRALVQHLKNTDPRRLYAQGSNNAFDDPKPNDNDDFWTVSATYREGTRVVLNIELLRGSMLYNHLGHLNNQYPSATTHDYTASTRRAPIPIISHETGQYLAYPDYADIPKYTGILHPAPLLHQKQLLEKSGMADLADAFHHASGKLVALCYKEDIESILRTPDIGGFALLDLQDYPGQGSGYVGLCNAFMEPKKFQTPEKFRQHTAPLTPLLLLDKRTHTTAAPLTATLKLAHYNDRPLENATATLTLTDAATARIHHQQQIPLPPRLDPGALHTIAENIRIPLAGIPAPAQLKLHIRIDGTPAQNEYDLWLYPEKTTYAIPKNIELTERLDPAAMRRLHDGKTLLVIPRLHELGNSIQGQFIANFWTIAFFKSYDGPGTHGLLMDPAHPLFKHFPTESHSNWQWFPMARHGRPMILDALPPGLRPLVQVIDNFETSRKLGLIIEARHGKGKLLLTSIDFLNHLDKPEVRQLLYSILRYMESAEFAPAAEVTEEQLRQLFRPPAAPPPAYESAQFSGLHG